MRKKEISSLDLSGTNGQEKARMTENNGQKGYSSKSGKASSQPRRRNAKANAAKKRQEGTRRQAFKLSDHLSEQIIEKLRGIK